MAFCQDQKIPVMIIVLDTYLLMWYLVKYVRSLQGSWRKSAGSTRSRSQSRCR